MPSKKPIHRLNTVNNAISILIMFIKHDSIGLVEIEDEIGISKTTAFRLVATMADRGLLMKEEKTKRYYPGPLLFQLVRKSQVNDIVSIAQPYIKELSQITDESIYLSTRSGFKYIFLDGIYSSQLLKVMIPIGEEIDLHVGAAGNLHLAYMSLTDVKNYYKRTIFEAFTPNTITEPTLFEEKLAHIRNEGFSSSFGETYSDFAAVTAPIWELGEEPAATIGIYFPMTRIDDQKKKHYTELIKTYAQKISGELVLGQE